MAFTSLLLVGFLAIFFAGNVVVSFDMEEEEIFGLFEVMGSLLEDPTWARTHPSPCTDTSWPGVECELLEETSIFHVTKIHVGPDVVTPPCKPSAKITPQSLLKLPYLKTLSLMNCFTKSPFSLSKHLFNNQSLSFLERLTLESNPSLVGEIPSTISNLANLKILSLSQNNLSGEIPIEIGGLVNLEQLDLSHNNLIGSIPDEIGENLRKLSILDISWNFLQETVPSSIGGQHSIEKIDLSANKLRGTLPPEFGKLRKLALLDLSRNFLTGPIPETLSGLQGLQYFIMDDNPLNARIPSFLGSLVELRVVSFSGCGLTGPIPTIFSSLTKLTALSLDNNNLNGTVPPGLGTLPSIDALNLSRNQLSGELLFNQDFITRLGQRLDIRGNDGLCTNNQEGEARDNNTCSRFLQNSTTCSSSAVFPSARNKTFAGKNPGRAESMKPKLYEGSESSNAHDSGQKICPLSWVLMYVTVFAVWLVSF